MVVLVLKSPQNGKRHDAHRRDSDTDHVHARARAHANGRNKPQARGSRDALHGEARAQDGAPREEAYGGDDGLLIDRRNELPMIDLGQPRTFYFLCFGLLVLWTLVCTSVVNSRFGLILQALRQSERRTINLGIRPLPFRLIAFVVSAVGTGLAGVLWANYARFVSPDMAAWTKSGEFMAIVILGGLGTLLGPIVGTAVYLTLEQVLTSWTEHWMIVMGPILTMIALFGRKGMTGRLFGQNNND